MAYTGHWLVIPRSKQYARSVMLFTEWLAGELGVDLVPSGCAGMT